MLLSTSYEVSLMLLVAGLCCWGLWANTLKMATKWRYELYVVDFAVGFALLAALAAITAGSLNGKELTFQDNLAIAAYRKIAYCLAAGFTFGLASYLLLATITTAGIAVGFTISLGLSLAISTCINMISGTRANLVPQAVAAACALAAVVIAAYAHAARADAARQAAEHAAIRPDPRDPRTRVHAPIPAGRGVLLGILSGIFMTLFSAVLDLGRLGDDGVAPYGAALMFGAGLLSAALFFSPLFWNFPVLGRSLSLSDYFRGGARNHLLGLFGGVLAAIGFAAFLLAWSAPTAAQPVPLLTFVLSHGHVLLASLCGLVFWNEFRAAEGRTALLFASSIVLMAVGIGMAAFAQT
jgi:glucose uptake protein